LPSVGVATLIIDCRFSTLGDLLKRLVFYIAHITNQQFHGTLKQPIIINECYRLIDQHRF
jgi:hypothetical protein